MSALQQIESEWATIYYQTPKAEKRSAYQNLLDRAELLGREFPGRAEPIVWQAIIKSTNADHQDAITALEAIKDAKELLQTAIRIDPKAMDGSAYVTLGTLYYMAPEWPIAFGDDAKARELLQTALQINPNGIDSNYFFGDFLVNNGQVAEAIPYFAKALKAPARKEQWFADNQLKKEAKQALDQAVGKVPSQHGKLLLSLLQAEPAKANSN